MTTFIYLFALGYAVFLRFNMGLARNSRGQQMRRYLLAALQAVLPLGIVAACAPDGLSLADIESTYAQPAPLAALVVSTLWIVTYNVVYDLSHRASSPDYDNHMDIAFGIYLYGWLTALQMLLSCVSTGLAAVVMGLLETVLITVPLAQAAYYATYHTCIDEAGMQPLLNTYLSEAVEFVRSFALWRTLVAILSAIVIALLLMAANTWESPVCAVAALATGSKVGLAVAAALFVYFSAYIWKPRHGLFVRTGIMTLYTDVRDYTRGLKRYRSGMSQRLATLKVEPAGGSERPLSAPGEPSAPGSPAPAPKGKTIIMVIGESACRDYMSAFQPDQPWPTTPWETQKRNDSASGFIFFPNAYSCAMQTVPSLERVLTERNQYNNMPFADSCSIIDIARRAGYRTSWYSNQSYIGINDTSVTLVAQTADTAKWVKKEGGAQQFDESLLGFLDELRPEADNFVVLHLKGSHFNYENRYPAAYAAEHHLRTDQGDVECYRNSIHYTDSLLHRVFDHASSRLNLQAMVYFSDHGGIPDMRRSPRFLGFKMVRIPLWVYLSDEYRSRHTATAKALEANRNRYFTNDLVYELMCGILDIRSNRYDPTQSIASEQYKYRRADLMTYDGRIRIQDDDLDNGGSDTTA